MPVYIGKSGDLVGCYRCLTDTQTSEYRATQLVSSIKHKLSHAILCYGFHYFFIFRNNFGLIVPAIAKHFNAGRADVVLTSSFMTLLLLGSGLF